jgi:hypothetical protein
VKLVKFPLSSTITRYEMEVHLGPWSRLILRRLDGSYVAAWRSCDEPEHLLAVWISPDADLRAELEGTEIEGPAGITAATVAVPPSPDTDVARRSTEQDRRQERPVATRENRAQPRGGASRRSPTSSRVEQLQPSLIPTRT